MPYIKRKKTAETEWKARNKRKTGFIRFLSGGADRGRTDDLLHAMQALCQLSYSPICVLRYDIIILYCPILSQYYFAHKGNSSANRSEGCG